MCFQGYRNDAKKSTLRIEDLQKLFKEFEKNPELANFLFNLNALEGTLKDNATLILDPNTPPFNLLTQPNKASKK